MTETIRILRVMPAGDWGGTAADEAVLDYDGRHRRRIVITGRSGQRYLLDLAEATHLRDGDGLALLGGGVLRIAAKPEPLMEVRAATPEALLRLAWHIGNRHLAADIGAERILIRRDHVIGHMLEHLGARVSEVEAPFDPEGGAYQDHGPHDHGVHDHGVRDHGDHDHGHDH